MRKKNIWCRIPYPLRATLYAAGIVFLLYAIYVCLGYPTLTLKQEFRRAEKAHFVGPSTIVEVTEDWEFDKMIVGETPYGVCFFGPDEIGIAGTNRTYITYYFSYREKTGDLTVLAPPSVFYGFWSSYPWDAELPLYIFSDVPDATRVHVQLRVSHIMDTSESDSKVLYEHDELFIVDGHQIADGVFKCTLVGGTTRAKNALGQVCAMSMGVPADSSYENDVIPITVRFYDSNNQLITEKQTELRSTDNP